MPNTAKENIMKASTKVSPATQNVTPSNTPALDSQAQQEAQIAAFKKKQAKATPANPLATAKKAPRKASHKVAGKTGAKSTPVKASAVYFTANGYGQSMKHNTLMGAYTTAALIEAGYLNKSFTKSKKAGNPSKLRTLAGKTMYKYWAKTKGWLNADGTALTADGYEVVKARLAGTAKRNNHQPDLAMTALKFMKEGGKWHHNGITVPFFEVK